MTKRVVCFHLYNDYSGSPKVLAPVLRELAARGWRIDLYTSRGGVLDALADAGVCLHHYPYRYSDNAVVTLLRYVLVQLWTFLLAWRYLFCRDVVFYINTLLPAGPALAGRLMGKRVVYHYHENAFVKGGFYRMLSRVMQRLAHRIICVSRYQCSFLLRQEKCTVVPNALPVEFVRHFEGRPPRSKAEGDVLMVGSLKVYKGTCEFVQLAGMLPELRFVLVINDEQEAIDAFWQEQGMELPPNLTVYPRQADVKPFYERAAVVLNLSNPRLFIETFGMTALEAMTAGLPVIVPPVGGIAEIVEPGVTGYHADVMELNAIAAYIQILQENENLYANMSAKCKVASFMYTLDDSVSLIMTIFG
ncbi:MAG: glycosyltransferase family 4 protein [Akkermansia sp.]|nr:glycosyltransferase family 4 protein [Akkermansia sp.]